MDTELELESPEEGVVVGQRGVVGPKCGVIVESLVGEGLSQQGVSVVYRFILSSCPSCSPSLRLVCLSIRSVLRLD